MRYAQSQKIFSEKEGVIALVIGIVALTSAYLLITGEINLNQSQSSSTTSATTQTSSKKEMPKKNVAPLTKRHGENVIITEEEIIIYQQ